MTSEQISEPTVGVWDGGGKPLGTSYGKLMMWYFLVSDAFTFATFLIAYGAIRLSTASWVNPEEVFNAFPMLHGVDAPLMFVSLMTFILIVSSVTMVLAVEEGHKMNKRGVERYLLGTIIGGSAFLGCQAWEWTHMITEGNTLFHNNYGPDQFGMFFFFITGFHGTHVLSGILLLIMAFVQTTSGVYEKRGHYEMVEKIGLYWHFVDLVWVFVFTMFYLI